MIRNMEVVATPEILNLRVEIISCIESLASCEVAGKSSTRTSFVRVIRHVRVNIDRDGVNRASLRSFQSV